MDEKVAILAQSSEELQKSQQNRAATMILKKEIANQNLLIMRDFADYTPKSNLRTFGHLPKHKNLRELDSYRLAQEHQKESEYILSQAKRAAQNPLSYSVQGDIALNSKRSQIYTNSGNKTKGVLYESKQVKKDDFCPLIMKRNLVGQLKTNHDRFIMNAPSRNVPSNQSSEWIRQANPLLQLPTVTESGSF